MTLIFPNKANVLIPYFCQVNTLRQFWQRVDDFDLSRSQLLPWALSVCRRNYRCVGGIIGVSLLENRAHRRLNLHTFQLREVQCYCRVALLAIEAF